MGLKKRISLLQAWRKLCECRVSLVGLDLTQGVEILSLPSSRIFGIAEYSQHGAWETNDILVLLRLFILFIQGGILNK